VFALSDSSLKIAQLLRIFGCKYLRFLSLLPFNFKFGFEDLDLLILLLQKLSVLLNLVGLTFYCLFSQFQFLNQLLLKTAHQGVHHLVSTCLHLKVPSESFKLFLEFYLCRICVLLSLLSMGLYRAKLFILTLDHVV